MNVTTRPLSKIEWKTISDEDPRRVFNDVQIEHPQLGRLTVTIEKEDNGFGQNKLLTTIKNSLGDIIGKDLMSINPLTKKIYDFSMDVNEKYRRKGYNIGELLRLFSVAEMYENKAPEIELYSKEKAIYFHSKYKFKPNNKPFQIRTDILATIAGDADERFADLSQRAQDLFNEIFLKELDKEAHISISKEVDKLTEEYIQRAFVDVQPDVAHPFYRGMYMLMTSDNLDKNKKFFNDLYKKHGLDYTI